MSTRGFTTRILHSDRSKPIEHGALHKPIHTSVPFGYSDARELARVFQGEQTGFTYARQGQPTAAALEEKITAMEEGVATVAFGTGMGAIASTVLSLLRSGDHLVSSRYLFGNTNSLFSTFEQMGVSVSFVDATDVANVEAALTRNTRMVFVETIANPRTQVADLARIGELCKQHDIVYFVDNTMTSPYLFLPKRVGASLIINSLTKCIGGHGNALGGAVTDTGLYDWSKYANVYDTYKKGAAATRGILQIRKKGLRDLGTSLAPEAAHHIAVGAETLALRMERTCANALKLAGYLEAHPKVSRVYYPGLESHPQHELAKALFRMAGGLFAFELNADMDCFDFLNKLKDVVSSSHLGDTRTLAIPVAHTIFYEMGARRRASMGIADSLIRISTGIEDIEDLIADFGQALRVC
ncbi:MAG: cystathionine gamma-synthase family protein [Betaproteobacteria bacterium]|jgi:O-acetylhomoserine (thiol)-lyase|nr:cystathionine gamma-synthase family protein [Betaproteobacteria bacterium]